MAAAEILNKRVGDYRTFITDKIFAPLNMSSTTFSEQQARNSGQFAQTWDGFSSRRIPYWFPEPTADFILAIGGLISNVNDMVKWVKFLLASLKDRHTSSKQLSEVIKITTQARSVSRGDSQYPEVSIQGYGLGWWCESYRGHNRIYHFGSLPGVCSRVSVYPEAGIALVLLANIDEKEIFNRIVENHVVDLALGLDPIDWQSRWKYTPGSLRKVVEQPPPLSMKAYLGTYRNEGYGEVTFHLPLCVTDPSSTSAEVSAAYEKIDSATGIAYTWQLQASWARIWASHFRLISLGDNLFVGQLAALFPHGHGKDKSPFVASASECAVQFIVEGGDVTGFYLYMDAYTNEEPANKPTLAAVHAHFVRSLAILEET